MPIFFPTPQSTNIQTDEQFLRQVPLYQAFLYNIGFYKLSAMSAQVNIVDNRPNSVITELQNLFSETSSETSSSEEGSMDFTYEPPLTTLYSNVIGSKESASEEVPSSKTDFSEENEKQTKKTSLGYK